jgi:predicted NBD/HSP70 family sugar kinase
MNLQSLATLNHLAYMMEKATREFTKQHNSRLVLKTIYEQDVISRAELARLTHLTRATVSNIVADLIDEELVVETGLGPSIGGKPPRLLNFAGDARQMLCLDLSTSYFRGAWVNLRGMIRSQVQIPVDGRTASTALSLVYELVDQLVAQNHLPILGIGIGTPGLVDSEQGIVQEAVNLGWHELPLKTLLEQHTGRPVYIANDSHLAALASYTFDPHNSQNLALIKAGRGIGAGIVLGGQLHYGDGFGAGEIGHVVVVEDGELCSCGNRGCLETVASIRGILQQVARQSGQATPTWDEVVQAVQQGDGMMEAILQQAGAHMGTAVAHLIAILNIKQIVLAGQLTRAGEPFLAGVRTAVQQRVLPAVAAGTNICCTTLGDDIVLMGASAFVLKQQLGVI